MQPVTLSGIQTRHPDSLDWIISRIDTYPQMFIQVAFFKYRLWLAVI
jgi:hypothetical protein